ncbi:MAG TPA: HlyD family efflux transporter periplasmic adaptor subunit [Vicinamibacterales bacterium]|jgi:multidrug resistance efflux pump|nr:HlyD family efflux transporter periplasmic adaptor subunit [Vicinamibacterales bacterium]
MKTRALVSILAILVVAGAAVAGWSLLAAVERPIPTAHVQRGRVETRVHAIGDLRPARAMQVAVPAMGGQQAIVALAESGTSVAAGDAVVEFDATEQEFALEQANFDLKLAEQEIVKAQAEAAVQAADDEVALLEARFAVRRAELDASANELVGAITAKQNLLLLDEARGRLASLEQEVKTRRQTTTASTDVLREKRNKAQVAVMVAQRNIDTLRVRAPFDGFVSVRQNMMALGGVLFPGVVLPEFRPGDMAFPGTVIAELVDTSRVEVTAKLPEHDRANVSPGQKVDIQVDAAPDFHLQGTVRSISSVASRQLFEGAGVRRFDIAFDILGNIARVRPGVTAALTIAGPVFEDAKHVPRAAIFDVSGQPTVYVRTASGFEPKAVKVRMRTDTVAVIDGLDQTAEVALVNPSAGAGGAKSSAPVAPVMQRAAR